MKVNSTCPILAGRRYEKTASDKANEPSNVKIVGYTVKIQQDTHLTEVMKKQILRSLFEQLSRWAIC